MAQTESQTDDSKNRGELIPQSCWGTGVKVNADSIRERVLGIQKEIAPCKLKIIGVTKYYGRDSIIEGYRAGLRDFGESRAIEAIEKIESLPDDIRQTSTFHFIGHLQTNKVGKVVKYFDYIQSVDSFKLAEVISKAQTEIGRKVRIMLQVNNAGEEQKYGFSKELLMDEMPKILSLKDLDIIGLMNIAPLNASEHELKTLFSDIRNYRDELEKKFSINLSELSMGMSDDYRIAVQEGATIIRLGRKLFTE